MIVLMQCVAEAVASKGFRGLMEIVPGGGFLYDVANDALRRLRDRKRIDELKDEVLQAANASFDEARIAAEKVAREVAATAPSEERMALEMYLTQLPGAVRQSLKRTDDPSGRSVPANFALNEPADLLRRLPAKVPHFRPHDALPGKPGWQLVELLGTGGFGEVWLARNPALSALKGAVKFGLDPQARERLLRHEGTLVNRVMEQGKHPNVVSLLDVHLEGDAPWLMYEYVPGGDLTGLILTWQSLSIDERVDRTVAALKTLASAVGHFHQLRPPLVHRDLKPANILCTGVGSRESGVGRAGSSPTPDSRFPTPELKVADFGIGGVAAAASLAQERSRGSTGALMSQLWGSYTPLYASPQQQAGNAPDPRDDVHALGVIGFQMLTGKLDATLGADYAKTLRRLNVPEALIELLGDCAAHDPDNRPKDAAELAERLASLHRAAPIEATVVADLAPPAPKPSERPRPTARPVTTLRERKRRSEHDEGVVRTNREPVPERQRGSSRFWLFFFLAVVLVGGGFAYLGWWLFKGGSGGTAGGGGFLNPLSQPTPRPQPPAARIEKVRSFPPLLAESGRPTQLAFSTDGKQVIAAFENGTTQITTAADGDPTRAFPDANAQRPAVSGDGRRALQIEGGKLNLKRWNEKTSSTTPLADFDDEPALAAFTGDDRWVIAAGGTTGWVKVQEINKSGAMTTYDGRVTALAVDPKSRFAASAGEGNKVVVWEPNENWRHRTTVSVASKPTAIAFALDGKRLYIGLSDGTLCGWDADKHAEFTAREQKLGPIKRIVPGNTDRHVVGMDAAGAAWVYDHGLQAGPWEIKGHGKVNAVAFGHLDEKPFALDIMATAGEDGIVQLWELFFNNVRAKLILGSPATALAFSPDGRTLATATADGTITLWKIAGITRGLDAAVEVR